METLPYNALVMSSYKSYIFSEKSFTLEAILNYSLGTIQFKDCIGQEPINTVI